MCHMLWFTLMDEFRAQIWRHQSSQVRSQRCTFKPGSGLSFRPLQNFTHFPHWLLLQNTCVTVSCWQRANYYTVFPEFLNHEDSVFVKLPQGLEKQVLYEWCSLNVQSIRQTGGVRERKVLCACLATFIGVKYPVLIIHPLSMYDCDGLLHLFT